MIVQIETLSALEQLEEIAAVPGVDSIFIGPADLSASMSHLGDMGHADVQAKLEDGARRCRKAGKPCGIVGGTPEQVARFLEYGFSWVAVASDMAMMVGRANEFLASVRRSATAKM